MAVLTDNQRQSFVQNHRDWSLEGKTLMGEFEFEDFVDAMGFVTSVALLAEKAEHHPDIDIRWNTVRLALTTHDEGDLTTKDTELADRIGSLYD
ncbi:MAG: 4a-hydroxytetrahydrobiopterin dehydratase [Acidimicrobiia bacterium]|nr:4a-hydroxytetrahydrobiopterin dehydratase [Acidimicrobiia bacterium]